MPFEWAGAGGRAALAPGRRAHESPELDNPKAPGDCAWLRGSRDERTSLSRRRDEECGRPLRDARRVSTLPLRSQLLSLTLFLLG